MAKRQGQEIGECQCANSAPFVYDQKNQSDEQRCPDQKIIQHGATGPVLTPRGLFDIREPSFALSDVKHRCKPVRVGVSTSNDAAVKARGKALTFGRIT